MSNTAREHYTAGVKVLQEAYRMQGTAATAYASLAAAEFAAAMFVHGATSQLDRRLPRAPSAPNAAAWAAGGGVAPTTVNPLPEAPTRAHPRRRG